MLARLQLSAVAAAWRESLSEGGTRRGNVLLFLVCPGLLAGAAFNPRAAGIIWCKCLHGGAGRWLLP